MELDRRILKQPLWAETVLRTGAEIEIVQFVGGDWPTQETSVRIRKWSLIAAGPHPPSYCSSIATCFPRLVTRSRFAKSRSTSSIGTAATKKNTKPPLRWSLPTQKPLST